MAAISSFALRCCLLAAIASPVMLGSTSSAQAQASRSTVTSPEELKPLSQSSSLLSLQGGQRLMEEAQAAVNAQKYDVAQKRLQDARQVFNQISNFYQDLSRAFSGIDPRISDSQRRKAFDTAEMRDRATLQLALVHRAQNQPELAVPLLVQLVNSQGPTRDLGKQAYQQLFEMGFVDVQYPRQGGQASN